MAACDFPFFSIILFPPVSYQFFCLLLFWHSTGKQEWIQLSVRIIRKNFPTKVHSSNTEMNDTWPCGNRSMAARIGHVCASISVLFYEFVVLECGSAGCWEQSMAIGTYRIRQVSTPPRRTPKFRMACLGPVTSVIPTRPRPLLAQILSRDISCYDPSYLSSPSTDTHLSRRASCACEHP